MLRVVPDTNLIVSAMLQPLGPPAQVFLLAANGIIQFCVRMDVLSEYEEVLRRPRLKRDAQHIEQVLQTLQRGHWVRPEQRVTACTDPDDRVCGVRVRGLPRERQHQRLPKHLAKHANRHATRISADSAPVPFVTKLITSRVNNCYSEKFNV